MKFDLDKAANSLSRNKILTQTAQLGLLTKLEKAGFKLTTAKPLLKLADELDLLGVLEASSDKVLPLVAKGIDYAPALLPLAGAALKTSPTVLTGVALASLTSSVAILNFIPDDTVTNVAIQTSLFALLGAVVPALSLGGAALLGKINK